MKPADSLVERLYGMQDLELATEGHDICIGDISIPLTAEDVRRAREELRLMELESIEDIRENFEILLERASISEGSMSLNERFFEAVISRYPESFYDDPIYLLLTDGPNLDGHNPHVGLIDNVNIGFTGEFDGPKYSVAELSIYDRKSTFPGLFFYNHTPRKGSDDKSDEIMERLRENDPTISYFVQFRAVHGVTKFENERIVFHSPPHLFIQNIYLGGDSLRDVKPQPKDILSV